MIHTELGGSLETLQWVVNAYTLAFAAFLLTGAALGDRLGRRRIFALGIALFTIASTVCALADDTSVLIAARAVQGAGAAAIMPLSLTLLAAAVPGPKRPIAIGIWGGVSGLGIALGPMIGGAVVSGLAWQWIFWINVPIGLIIIPLVLIALRESRGPDRMLDPIGLALAGAGVLAIVWAVVRAEAQGWGSTVTITELIVGTTLLGVFVVWQRRAPAALLPVRLFRSRGFVAVNGAAIAWTFGTFGSVFLLAQFFQVVQGYSPLAAGVRTLPWTMVPMVVAPLTGLVVDRIGSRTLITYGMVLQAGALAWIATVSTADVAYGVLVPPFVIAGIGMGMVLAPMSNAVLATVTESDHGKASGTNGTLRELGVALGVAVFTAVFAANGSYTSGPDYIRGMVPAVFMGAAIVLFGALLARAIPEQRSVGQKQVKTGREK